MYITDIGEGNRAHPGPFRVIFDPSRWGGQNHKFCDCARTRHTVVSRFGALISVHIYVGFAPLPRCRVQVCCFGGSRCVSTSILIPHLVRPFSSARTLLTCFLQYSERVEPPCMLLAPQGASLHLFLCLGVRTHSRSPPSLSPCAEGF